MTQFNHSGTYPMTARPRMKWLAVCIGVALAQWSAGSAWADSAVGVDMANGNTLNPPGRSAIPRPIADGGYDTVRRSPTGQLYGAPYDVDTDVNQTESGWEYTGGIEAGVLGGNANLKNSQFRQYKDLNNGAYLNYFEVEANKAGSANYMSLFGGGSGQSDQFYGMQVGRYNDWKAKIFYNETLHVFSSNWKSLFNGEGSGNLTTGLPVPKAVISGSLASNTGPGMTAYGAAGNCTAAAPCWTYGTKIYANASALVGINGITGEMATNGNMPAAGTPPQSNIALAISDKLAAMPDSELSLIRRKGGVRFDKTITDNWKGYASYTLEERKGARPFAMNETNVSTEIPEPIDYQTHEFLGGLQYADSLTQANLRASLSMFRNNISTLNVQYPFLAAVTGNGSMQTATYDLYPDNMALNLKGEFARSLPDFYHGRFNASVAWGTSQQDDDLLAPISAAQSAQLTGLNWYGTSAGFANNTAKISNWNTTQALSQLTAKQRIDTSLLDLGLALRPTDALGVKGSFRFYDIANKGGYTAYNPLTGQFGRGFVDGNGLGNQDVVVAPGTGTPVGCFAPSGFTQAPTCAFGVGPTTANGSNNPVFGQARSTQQLNYGLAADYDLTRSSSVNAALEREEFKRTFREREKTWEDKLKLGYVNRGLGDATLRASYEVDTKRGSEYRYRTFEDLGTGLPGMSVAEQVANAGTKGYAAFNANLFTRYSYYFRKYDQADRDQNIFNARVNYQAREDLDLGFVVQTKDIKYPDSFYGADKDKQDSLSLEINYQPSSGNNLYAFYSYQQARKSMNLNSGTGLAPGGTACTSTTVTPLTPAAMAACADSVRPLSAKWNSETFEKNDLIGVGFQSRIGTMQFGIDYTYANSSTEIRYGYGTTALLLGGNSNAIIAAAGNSLPSMTFVTQTLNFNLLIPVSKRLSVRLYDRVELGSVKDWHYDGVVKNAVANYDSGTLLLDSGPTSYRANVIGFFLQYKL